MALRVFRTSASSGPGTVLCESPVTGLPPFESSTIVGRCVYDIRDVATGQTGSVRGASKVARYFTRGPCLRFDSSVIPIWFDTPGIRFHDFWTGRIEWRGQIFHTTHIRGVVQVMWNIIENRRKLSEIPSTRHAQRPT